MKATLKESAGLGLTLALFAAGACVALAAVYSITAPTINGLEKKQTEQSLAELFPQATSFQLMPETLVSADPAVRFTESYVAVTGPGERVGIAIKAFGPSYGGDASILVGVNAGNGIAGIKILTLKDTPGLGANATSPNYFVDRSSGTTWPMQFKGKSLSDAFEVKNDIVAITASTITSKALTRIVKAAGDAGYARLKAFAEEGK